MHKAAFRSARSTTSLTIWPTGLNTRRKIASPQSNICDSSSLRMEKLDRNFADFLRLLNSHRVEYRWDRRN
jgi:hypothetical protein